MQHEREWARGMDQLQFNRMFKAKFPALYDVVPNVKSYTKDLEYQCKYCKKNIQGTHALLEHERKYERSLLKNPTNAIGQSVIIESECINTLNSNPAVPIEIIESDNTISSGPITITDTEPSIETILAMSEEKKREMLAKLQAEFAPNEPAWDEIKKKNPKSRKIAKGDKRIQELNCSYCGKKIIGILGLGKHEEKCKRDHNIE